MDEPDSIRPAPSARLDEPLARALGRDFANAIVDGDLATAAAVVDQFLADREAREPSAPLRPLMPVSVASARVGRTLALRWCLAGDVSGAKVGGFCLRLIRDEEGPSAPDSDAHTLVGALDEVLESGDRQRAANAVAAIALAFDPRVSLRDRTALTNAVLETPGVVEAASAALASSVIADQRLGADIAAALRSIEQTSALAGLVRSTDDAETRRRAVRALRAMWSEGDVTDDDFARAASGIRFGRRSIEALLAEGGDSLVGREGTARLVRLLDLA